jgi:hypothetical protein
VAIFVSFLAISLALVIFEISFPAEGSGAPEQDGRWFSEIFFGIHSMLVNPVITLLGIISFLPQAREILSRRSPGALSIPGLAVQAVVFAAVALYWPWRMSMGSLRDIPWGSLISWYQLVGWAAVDNAVFAVVQAALLWVALHRRGETIDGEAAPLLNG